MIGFDTLRARLIDQLRYRIQNGEITERALALKAGISQPHLHNMLKGVRGLNAGRSDQLLMKLGLTALDLFEGEELRSALFLRARQGEAVLEIPVLQDRLAPGLPWPERLSPFERVDVPLRYVSRVIHPIVARLGEDSTMKPIVNSGDLVLLDRGEPTETNAGPDTLFAVQLNNGDVALRWLRYGRGRLYLISAGCRDRPSDWEMAAGTRSRIVLARAIPLRSMRQLALGSDPLLQPRDIPPALVRQSAAS